MTAASKYFVLLFQNKKSRNIIIGTVIGIIVFLIMIFASVSDSNSQNSAAIATAAENEYVFWITNTPEDENLSCQGQRYCEHFNSGVVDWCCYFVGYCIDISGYDVSDFGFSPSTNTWKNNLSDMGKLRDSSTYTPKVGNPVFFNYSGRSNYASTGFVAHIGIVTEVNDGYITVVAGNEYNGETENWANVSYVNRYQLSLSDDSIACYGAVGSSVISTGLSNITRNIICRNEVGVLYDDLESSDYGSVTANDNGALSIGVYGWHGNNALSLLQTAYSISNAEINNIATSFSSSGSMVLNAIKYGADWSSHIPDVTECSCLKAMLLSDAGRQAQDQTSAQNAQEYIDICFDNGLSDSKSIAYCCDILNQYGTGSFEANVYGNGYHGVLYGVTASMSLEDIYNSKRAWSDSNYNYEARRTWTYNYLKNLDNSVFN